MERLATNSLPMSQINVQRRMRPVISTLIRYVSEHPCCDASQVNTQARETLYPKLEDHPLVSEYSHVQGFATDIFFLTHDNKENSGADDIASKFNMFEVS